MTTQVTIPGYVTGTWAIDTTHSEVSFQVRQFGIAKVRGTFDDFEGTIVTAQNPLDSSVNATITTTSVNTRNTSRDKHLRQNDFLHVEQHPTMTFTSTGVRPDGDTFLIDGDLTIRTVTKQTTLTLHPTGFDTTPDNTPQARFTAHTQISRKDFGITGGASGAVISDKVTITLDITATKQN